MNIKTQKQLIKTKIDNCVDALFNLKECVIFDSELPEKLARLMKINNELEDIILEMKSLENNLLEEIEFANNKGKRK